MYEELKGFGLENVGDENQAPTITFEPYQWLKMGCKEYFLVFDAGNGVEHRVRRNLVAHNRNIILDLIGIEGIDTFESAKERYHKVFAASIGDNRKTNDNRIDGHFKPNTSGQAKWDSNIKLSKERPKYMNIIRVDVR